MVEVYLPSFPFLIVDTVVMKVNVGFFISMGLHGCHGGESEKLSHSYWSLLKRETMQAVSGRHSEDKKTNARIWLLNPAP